VSWAAMFLVAGAEWRTRRAALLALGLVIGLAGGLVVAGAVVTRRTTSAYPRLVDAVHRDDARAFAMAEHAELTAAVGTLPGVRTSWTADAWVGEVALDGLPLTYSTVTAPSGRPAADLMTPVVLRGRAPDPAALDEVMLSERFAAYAHASVGSVLTLRMLTLDQFRRFATGVGEPAGPRQRARVVGIMRMPSWETYASHVTASPAFAARYGHTRLSRITYLRLGPSATDRRAFAAAAERLAARARTGREQAGQSDFEVVYPARTEDAVVRPARRATAAGLLVALGAASAVALLVVAQAVARHYAVSARAQRVEAVLGLTTAERVLARLVPITAAALLAAALAAGCGALAGSVQPLGGLAGFEPLPGYRADVPATVVGAVVTGLGTLLAAAAAAAVAGRSAGRRRRGRPRSAPVPGGPLVLAGVRLGAVHAGRAAAALTAAVAIAVAALTFDLSLDRLISTPGRWGGTADLIVADPLDGDLARLRADPRVTAVTEVSSGWVTLDGERVEAYAYRAVTGPVGATVVAGRLPADAGEVCVGVRLAERRGLRVGDAVTARAPDGSRRRLRIVGIGVGSHYDASNRLGAGVLLHPDAMGPVAASGEYRQAQIRAAPGATDDLVAAWGRDREVYPRELPPEIEVLRGLRPVSAVVAAVMAAAVVLVLLHTLRSGRRRARRDLAVLRALGVTGPGRWVVLAVVALRAVVPAVLAGVPLGFGVGRAVWHEVATGSGVGGDASLPVWVAVACAVAVPVVAVAVTVPGRLPVRPGSRGTSAPPAPGG